MISDGYNQDEIPMKSKKVQVGKEKAQSEKKIPTPKTEVGKTN